MSKTKDRLFRLISVLKPTEKAYFKKFAYKLEKQQSILFFLFDEAEKMVRGGEPWQEERVMEGFRREFPRQSYPKIKSRLLETLLDAIREYDKKNQEIARIFDLLATAESLKKRNLFEDALHFLRKAEKLCVELEQLELLILVRSKRYHFEIFTLNYRDKYPENETISELFGDLDFLKRRIEHDLAAFRILHFQKSIGVPRSEEDFRMLAGIRALPAFQELAGDEPVEIEGPLSSRLNLAVALAGIAFSTGDIPAVIRVGEKMVKNYEVGDKLRRLNNSKFLGLFDSFLQACLLSLDVKRYEKYYPLFKEVETFGEDDANLKAGIDLYVRSIYAIVSGQPGQMTELIGEFETIREKDFIPNYRKVSLAFYMGLGPFLNEEHELAFRQIQWLKNHSQLGLRYDIEVGISGMECLILLERGDFDLLESRLRSFGESLRRHGRKFRFEQALLQLLKKALREPAASRQDVYAESLWEMEEILEKHPEEAAFLQALDIRSWLESRLKGEAFKQAYFRNNIPEQVHA